MFSESWMVGAYGLEQVKISFPVPEKTVVWGHLSP